MNLKFWKKETPIGERKGWLNFNGSFRDRFDPQFFQKGGTIPTYNEAKAHAAVYACVGILSQEVARLRLRAWRNEKDGSRTEMPSSAAALVMRRPNHYQTRSDFFQYMMDNLLLSGNAYAYAERSETGRILKLHPRPSNEVMPWTVPGSGEIFYSILKRDLDMELVQKFPEKFLVPQRDILHIKIGANRHPLMGETPLTGLQYAIPQGIAIQRDSTSFFSRMSRPSGVLTTPKRLGPEAAERLKKQWESGMADNFQGRTAVLDNEMTWQPLTMTAADSELIKQYKMTVEDVAMVYRIPLYMLGDLTKATYQNVESMQKGFQAGSLGFYTEHIEASLDQFFDLDPNTYAEFDMERGIVRTEFESRMGGLTKAVQGGILTINEARSSESRGPVDGGDSTFLQRQNWPIDMLGADAVKEAAKVNSDPATPSVDDSTKAVLARKQFILTGLERPPQVTVT